MTVKNQASLDWAHPLVKEWFLQKFGEPTEPQIFGWPHILRREDTLISAPTGSGKTLAAFLICIDQLVRLAIQQALPDLTQVVYISPLKALSNDVQKNLLSPLHEIEAIARKHQITMQPIRISVRTGDTPAKDRQAMLKKPPHILVTTPESFYILLTAEKSRLMLKSVNTVIVDEIHALAANKRGTHLALSLERLAVLSDQAFIRIGLSATQKPIALIANFLLGNRGHLPAIINIGHVRQLSIEVSVPSSELAPVASHELWDEIYDQMTEVINAHRTTLIFVNTRRLAERVSHQLTARLGEAVVAAHHGSLSRKLRHEAETKLKNGELKVLVATASLELGIDIGNIDIVLLVGSPRTIAASLQRIGRAGHWHGAVSKGKIFATTRNELLECAALVYAIHQRDLDRLIIREEPLDILAQQIIASCATQEWVEADLLQMIKKAYPYRNLSLETFNKLLTMLSEGIAGSRGRYSAYLFRDQVNQKIRARRGSRITAIMNGGAIPETGLFAMIREPTHTMVGTLDEDFAIESSRGDIILLGTTSWRIKRVESRQGRVLVEDAHGMPPSVPFWRGEAPARSDELSYYVSFIKEKMDSLLPREAPPIDSVEKSSEILFCMDWLIKNCGLNQAGAAQLLSYLQLGRMALGAMPTQKTIIAERFFDEGGGMQLIIHSPFGGRINKAWGLALRKKFCRSFNFELQAAATDDGINIALTEQHSFPLGDVFHFLNHLTIKEVLIQAVLQSPLFASRWRASATRSLALPRFRMGRKIPPNILRMLADDLLAAVFPDAAACQDNLAGEDIKLPDHPIINEAMHDALTESLDLDGLMHLLQKIMAEKITCLAIDTTVPSVFSHEILNANPYAFLDDAPLEERRARAVEMRRILPQNILETAGQLDQAAILSVKQHIWPDLRSRDELHDFLQTVIVYPKDYRETLANWHDYFAELTKEHRVGCVVIANLSYWFSVEKKPLVDAIYNGDDSANKEAAMLTLIKGWLLYLGPTTAHELQLLLTLPEADITQQLLKIEASGMILRGHFRTTHHGELEWCERRLLARIHSLTVEKLRQEITPVTPLQFMYWLLAWQHALPGQEWQGEAGLLSSIRQLQGLELPANSWETHIFTKRLKHYDKAMLDKLCLSGVIQWGRLSPPSHQAAPKSNMPITFFIRNESDWLLMKEGNTAVKLSAVANLVYQFLETHGASFLNDIVAGVSHLKTEIEMALWELVSLGKVTADSFDNLRALIDKKRRLHTARLHRSTFSFNEARWSLLKVKTNADKDKQLLALCWLLLNRYGVIFRDLLKKEKGLPPWRELLITLRHLEASGEIRGGRFVAGFLGEQFALPYAMESLRASRKRPLPEKPITLSAVDPLNLVGIILPGEKVSRFSKKKVTF